MLEDGGHQMHKYPEHFLFDSPLSDTRFNKNNFKNTTRDILDLMVDF